MARPQLVGATAAAMLPAALSAAVLVSAPFAGTTTAPLADAQKATGVSGHQVPAAKPAAGSSDGDTGLSFSIPSGSVAALAAGEVLMLCVGGGVLVVARRRRFADD